MKINEVNEMSREEFVSAFGHVYESSPGLAAAAWEQRPFHGCAALVDAFRAAAVDLDSAGVLALLRAHPQLAARIPMTAASTDEQQSAGLTDLDAEARLRIESDNARYAERFGFPFIIAVRGLRPADVAAALDERLGHDIDEEKAIALAQVQRIAELRISQVVTR